MFRLAEAAVDHPDDTVRTALFPVVGEGTLRDLVREAKANKRGVPGPRPDGAAQLATPTTTAGCCRRCSPRWTFRCNNTA